MAKLIEILKTEAPLSLTELKEFISSQYRDLLTEEVIPNLSDEIMIGLILLFFKENNIDFSINKSDVQIIFTDVVNTFRDYEKVISHYS